MCIYIAKETTYKKGWENSNSASFKKNKGTGPSLWSHPPFPPPENRETEYKDPTMPNRKKMKERKKKKKKSQITKVNHWLWAIYFTARWSVLCVDPPHLQNSFFTKEPKALPKLPCTHLFISHSPNLQPCIFNAQSEENNLPQVN